MSMCSSHAAYNAITAARSATHPAVRETWEMPNPDPAAAHLIRQLRATTRRRRGVLGRRRYRRRRRPRLDHRLEHLQAPFHDGRETFAWGHRAEDVVALEDDFHGEARLAIVHEVVHQRPDARGIWPARAALYPRSSAAARRAASVHPSSGTRAMAAVRRRVVRACASSELRASARRDPPPPVGPSRRGPRRWRRRRSARVGARFAPQAARAWTPRGTDGAMFRAIDAAALSRAEATRGVVARAILRERPAKAPREGRCSAHPARRWCLTTSACVSTGSRSFTWPRRRRRRA